MIRQAIVRYLDARSSILEARAEKIRHNHRWQKIDTEDMFNDPRDTMYAYRVSLYECATCGEHKKITLP